MLWWWFIISSVQRVPCIVKEAPLDGLCSFMFVCTIIKGFSTLSPHVIGLCLPPLDLISLAQISRKKRERNLSILQLSAPVD